MTKGLFCSSFLILVLIGGCWGQDRGGVSAPVAAPLIVAVLSTSKTSGSLEYWGRCDNIHEFPDFPKLHTPRKSDGPPLQILREMFSDDPKMQITQEPDGTIRMVEADVPSDFLALRIGHISFGNLARKADPTMYAPMGALRTILRTPEAADFMTTHNIRWPFNGKGGEAWEGSHSFISPKVPHVSGDLSNVTLSQALDYVLQTFPGFWIYENCAGREGERTVFFKFYQNGPRAVPE